MRGEHTREVGMWSYISPEQRRTNEEFWSTTDRQARMFRKGTGKEGKLCYFGHLLTENRHGLIIDVRTTLATGTAERKVALEMLQSLPGIHRATVGADKGYDAREFVDEVRSLKMTPHIAANDTYGRSASKIERLVTMGMPSANAIGGELRSASAG